MEQCPAGCGIFGRYFMKRAFLALAALAALSANGQSFRESRDVVPPIESPAAGPAPAVAPASPDGLATPPASLPPAVPLDAYVPMTARQKFSWTVGCVVDWKWILYSGARAGVDQWDNSPAQWKQGARGYARRYEAAHTLEAFEDTAWFAGAALHHEDPRYLRSGRSGFFPRLADALKVGLLSRRDNGSIGFSYARTVAGLGTEMFERVVFPDAEAFTAGSIALDALWYVGLHEAQSVGREFLPDILRGRASTAVRNLGIPLTAPTRPRP